MYNILNLKNNCPECNANVINDTIKGEFICSACGYVIEEQLEDYGHDGYNNKSYNNQINSRASGFNSIAYHDFGLHTEIDHKGKDYTGKGFNDEVKKTITNLRKWNTIIRISNSKERRLSNVLTKINEICSTISFPNVVCETAALIYRIYENKYDTKGKSSTVMAAAVVYYACKICTIIRSLDEIIKVCSTDEDHHGNLKLASKYYRSMVMICAQEDYIKNQPNEIQEKNEIQNGDQIKNINKIKRNYNHGISDIQVISIGQYISKLANLSNFDTKIERLALEIAKKTENHLLSDGKSPNGIAAAYLYLASILLGVNILQMDISKLAGVTEVTIRNRCKDILTSYRITLRIKPNSNNHNNNYH
ncbi:MAG: transcription factor IIB [Thermoproteota archaeon]|nr:transcription factor IIB [Thermoproteota archaeon]